MLKSMYIASADVHVARVTGYTCIITDLCLWSSQFMYISILSWVNI